jgi:hypothetical protein
MAISRELIIYVGNCGRRAVLRISRDFPVLILISGWPDVL